MIFSKERANKTKLFVYKDLRNNQLGGRFLLCKVGFTAYGHASSPGALLIAGMEKVYLVTERVVKVGYRKGRG